MNRVRSRYLFTRRDVRGADAPLASATRDGVILRSDLGQGVWNPGDDVSNYKLVEPGDFVIGLRSFQHGIAQSHVRGLVSPAYIVLRSISESAEPRFFAHYFRSSSLIAALENLAQGIRQGRTIPYEGFADLPLPVPALDEQRRIADFLDEQVALLNRASELRERQRTLMREAVDSEITDLVVGASGKERVIADFAPLGNVPRHWGQGRLRSVRCEVQTGPFGSQLHADEYVSNGWPLVNPANLRDGGITADPSMTVDDTTRARLARHILRPGDVVFGRRGELGRSALVGPGQDGWLCGTGSLRVRFAKSEFDGSYLSRFLRLPAIRSYFQSTSVGSTMDNLNTAILLGMPLLIPPRAEQVAIAQACDVAANRAARVDTFVGLFLRLLAERKSALITAAVTGQFDVSAAREVA